MIQKLFILTDDLPKPKTTEIIRKGSITEYTAAEEKEDGRRWRMFRIGEQDHRVDMKAIEPYKKVISHGGKSYQNCPYFLVLYQKCKCIKKLSLELRKICNKHLSFILFFLIFIIHFRNNRFEVKG